MFPKQFRIHAVLILAFFFIIIFPLLSEKPDAEKDEAATRVALEFLQLVDADRYAESWRSAAPLMREKVPEQEWIAILARSRELSGPMVERTKESASYSTTAKDSPDGEYVMLVFETKYQRSRSASEYVTVMLADGRWQVAGYFIK